jgi:DNA ligase-1
VNGEDDDVKGVVAKEGGEENGGGDGDVEMVSSRQKIADLADHANRLKDVKDPSVATHEKSRHFLVPGLTEYSTNYISVVEPAREKASAKHSPSKRTKSVVTTKVKNEDNKGDEEDEEDEEPVRKRSKRNGKVAKSTPTKEETGVKTAARDQKPTVVVLTDDVVSKPRKKKSEASNVPPPIKPVAVVQVAKTEDMEVVDDVENEEEDEDDEDEKPELAAKAREKVQSTLQSHGKDPYPDWKPGEPVPYAALCTTFSLVEMTTKRLIISAHCSLFLRQVLRLTPNDLLPTVQLMANKLAADYAGIELGIGESLIMKAIGESTGRSLATIKADQNEIGDLGLVAAKSRSNQPTMFRPKPLTVRGVLDGLMNIAIVQGNGAQQRKVDGIKKLLSSADAANAGQGSKGVDITEDKGGASEAKYIVRFLEGKPRLGLAEKTVIVAVAHAFVIHETEAGGGKLPSTEQLAKGEAILKTVYRYCHLLSSIIPT